MSDRFVVGVLVLSALTLAACEASEEDAAQIPSASPTPPLSDDEKAQFAEVISHQGFDSATLIFDQGRAVVEEDIAFDVRAHLATSHDARDKGYINTELSDPKRFGSIGFTVSTAANEKLSAKWTTAFETAVERWQKAVPWKRIKLTWLPPGQRRSPSEAKMHVVTLKMGPVLGIAPAMTGYPRNGKPVDYIHVNPTYNRMNSMDDSCSKEPAGIEDLTPEQMAKTAVHEIGHVLGFMHPGLNRLVIGTMASRPRSKDEAQDPPPNYPSVMWPGCVQAPNIVSWPSEDDIKTAQYIDSHGPDVTLDCSAWERSESSWCIAI